MTSVSQPLAVAPPAMTDLPAAARQQLVDELLPSLLTPVRRQAGEDGATAKTVWRLYEGALLESVLMSYPDRTTVCVSSQVGCGMAWPFCATGQGGLTRNLSTAEIVEQVVAEARLLAGRTRPHGARPRPRVDHVVFMGMGEPLANFPAVVGALRRLTDPAPAGLGLGQRQVTVSTVGLVPGMDRLADEGLAVTLAVSLHAPDDELRDRLVPVNRRWPIDAVLEAAWRYAASRGRRVSIEYALIRDVNDQAERAHRLGRLLRGRPVHVNLIPLNPTPGTRWSAPRPRQQAGFGRILAGYGVVATVRDTRGREIGGACGQLASRPSDRTERRALW